MHGRVCSTSSDCIRGHKVHFPTYPLLLPMRSRYPAPAALECTGLGKEPGSCRTFSWCPPPQAPLFLVLHPAKRAALWSPGVIRAGPHLLPAQTKCLGQRPPWVKASVEGKVASGLGNWAQNVVPYGTALTWLGPQPGSVLGGLLPERYVVSWDWSFFCAKPFVRFLLLVLWGISTVQLLQWPCFNWLQTNCSCK